MRQHVEQKAQVPVAILFFRMGDFYENARTVAWALELTPTLRNGELGPQRPDHVRDRRRSLQAHKG